MGHEIKLINPSGPNADYKLGKLGDRRQFAIGQRDELRTTRSCLREARQLGCNSLQFDNTEVYCFHSCDCSAINFQFPHRIFYMEIDRVVGYS